MDVWDDGHDSNTGMDNEPHSVLDCALDSAKQRRRGYLTENYDRHSRGVSDLMASELELTAVASGG